MAASHHWLQLQLHVTTATVKKWKNIHLQQKIPTSSNVPLRVTSFAWSRHRHDMSQSQKTPTEKKRKIITAISFLIRSQLFCRRSRNNLGRSDPMNLSPSLRAVLEKPHRLLIHYPKNGGKREEKSSLCCQWGEIRAGGGGSVHDLIGVFKDPNTLHWTQTKLRWRWVIYFFF